MNSNTFTACVSCSEPLEVLRCPHCGVAQRAGDYRVQRVLANGSHGRVYVAQDVSGRSVVLKELLFALVPSDLELDAFEREANILSELHHPGIPRHVGHFREGSGIDTRLYLVQEFIDGTSLEARRQVHLPSEQEALAVLRQLLEILVYLHGRSPPVVHRDIKPANVLCQPDGRLALVDFGAARVLPGDGTHGATLVGTVGYMAPEQLGGLVSIRSDLYSVGATLVHFLTGGTPEVWLRRDLSVDLKGLPISRGLQEFLGSLLARRSKDRPASAREALLMLDAALRPRPRSGLLSMGAVTFAALLLIGAYLWLPRPRALVAAAPAAVVSPTPRPTHAQAPPVIPAPVPALVAAKAPTVQPACAEGRFRCSSGCCPVRQVALGTHFLCVLTEGGNVRCRGGSFIREQLGHSSGGFVDVPGLQADVEELFAGADSVCGKVASGQLRCFGDDRNPSAPHVSEATRVAGLPPLRDLSVSLAFDCGLTTEGEALCWGNSSFGQVGMKPGGIVTSPVRVGGLPEKAISVGTGDYHSCAVGASGHVWCWGGGGVGHGAVPEQIVPIDNAVAVDGGFAHACALLRDGRVACWGDNRDGQLGDGSRTSHQDAALVQGVSDAVKLGVGFRFACALSKAGSVYCWGANENGEMGDGTTARRLLPVRVPLQASVTQLVVGTWNACAVTSAKRVLCWGHNATNQLDDHDSVDRPSPMAIEDL